MVTRAHVFLIAAIMFIAGLVLGTAYTRTEQHRYSHSAPVELRYQDVEPTCMRVMTDSEMAAPRHKHPRVHFMRGVVQFGQCYQQ